jgi:endonuclease/exonuclease/phosphatase family metal-dependent hydrolase
MAVCFPLIASAQTRTLRIVTYNIEADVTNAIYPTWSSVGPPLPGLVAPPNDTNNYAAGGVLEGIGEELVNGNAQPLDIVALQETTSNTKTVAPIVNALNTFYGVPGMYSNSSYQATESFGDPTFGNGPNALVYNTTTVRLLESVPVDPPNGSFLGSSSGEYREVMRYELAPAGVATNDSNIFYIYVSHYKASSGSANEAKRLGEARIIRNDEAMNLPATARVLYVGDYNVNYSWEAGYQTILSNTSPNGIPQGQGIDPLNATGATNINWSSYTTAPKIVVMLTEHSFQLQYRDDLQVMTTNIFSGAPDGLSYIPGTYHAFANNGSMGYYGTVNSGANTALNNRLVTNAPVFVSSSQLYVDLTSASDHLPVVADYTIPIPAPQITGVSLAGTDLIFTVSNGITNAVYTVLAGNDLATAASNWTAVATTTAPGDSFAFTATNVVSADAPSGFFILRGN